MDDEDYANTWPDYLPSDWVDEPSPRLDPVAVAFVVVMAVLVVLAVLLVRV